MGVDDIDLLPFHEPPDAMDVAEHPERIAARLQREPGQRLEPRVAGLLLEAAAGNHAEEHPVTTSAEPAAQMDHGIGASRPPPIGGELEDHEPGLARHAARLFPRSPTSSP